MPITKTVKTLVKEAKQQTKSIAPTEAYERVKSGVATLVDIRDIRELERDGRIAGAVHAPRGMLEFWVDPESPYHKEVFSEANEIILFCASSGRSALAAKALQDMGMENICDMDGGFNEWKKVNLPTINE
mgnify:CR=1 FL=1